MEDNFFFFLKKVRLNFLRLPITIYYEFQIMKFIIPFDSPHFFISRRINMNELKKIEKNNEPFLPQLEKENKNQRCIPSDLSSFLIIIVIKFFLEFRFKILEFFFAGTDFQKKRGRKRDYEKCRLPSLNWNDDKTKFPFPYQSYQLGRKRISL